MLTGWANQALGRAGFRSGLKGPGQVHSGIDWTRPARRLMRVCRCLIAAQTPRIVHGSWPLQSSGDPGGIVFATAMRQLPRLRRYESLNIHCNDHSKSAGIRGQSSDLTHHRWTGGPPRVSSSRERLRHCSGVSTRTAPLSESSIPQSVWTHKVQFCPVAGSFCGRFQIRAERSQLAVIKRRPSGVNSRSVTMLRWRRLGPSGLPVAISHNRAVESSLAVATVERSGL